MTSRNAVLIGMVLLAAVSRLMPHPPNFTPIIAMTIFGGAYFSSKQWAFIVPLVAMLFSDLLLANFDSSSLFVYASFLVIAGIGLWLRRQVTTTKITGSILASSILFFVITNFGVWMTGLLYPMTMEGLISCYIAAVPFFRNALLGDVIYSMALFGSFALASKFVPFLKKPQLVA